MSSAAKTVTSALSSQEQQTRTQAEIRKKKFHGTQSVSSVSHATKTASSTLLKQDGNVTPTATLKRKPNEMDSLTSSKKVYLEMSSQQGNVVHGQLTTIKHEVDDYDKRLPSDFQAANTTTSSDVNKTCKPDIQIQLSAITDQICELLCGPKKSLLANVKANRRNINKMLRARKKIIDGAQGNDRLFISMLKHNHMIIKDKRKQRIKKRHIEKQIFVNIGFGNFIPQQRNANKPSSSRPTCTDTPDDVITVLDDDDCSVNFEQSASPSENLGANTNLNRSTPQQKTFPVFTMKLN